MPTYEYRCRDCGEHLEVVQKFTDDALTDCPGCGGSLRKVFGSIGITFKGSGFYKTDSRSGAKRATGATSESKSESASEAKSESKSDASSKDASTTKSDSSSSKSDSSGSSSSAASTKAS